MNQGLHLVVFCAVDYQHLLADHLLSVDKFVQDKIISKTVISNAPIETDCNLILDKEFWNIIDPNFVYMNVYKHNWLRQQILKLNLDKILSGNILLSDVEIVYLKPITWCQDQQYLQFKKHILPSYDATEFVDTILDYRSTVSFLTESMIFSTDILYSLRKFVEKKFSTDQLDAYRKIVYDNPKSSTPTHKIFMSEYELYNNYMNIFYPDRVWKQLNYNLRFFSSRLHAKIYTKNKDSQTQWINFYEQIKDTSWPDCYSESKFNDLPAHIQQECIIVHGYCPKDQNNK